MALMWGCYGIFISIQLFNSYTCLSEINDSVWLTKQQQEKSLKDITRKTTHTFRSRDTKNQNQQQKISITVEELNIAMFPLFFLFHIHGLRNCPAFHRGGLSQIPFLMHKSKFKHSKQNQNLWPCQTQLHHQVIVVVWLIGTCTLKQISK